MMSSKSEPPADPVNPAKGPVHISIPLVGILAIMAVLLVLAFVAGWLLPVPGPFDAGGARDKGPRVPGTTAKDADSNLPALTDATLPDDQIVQTRAGRLQFTRLKITPPLEFIQQMAVDPSPRKWFFHTSVEELRQFLKDAGLSPEQEAALWATHAEEFGDVHVFGPNDDFVRGLNADVKRMLYTRLGEDDRNIDQVNVYRFLGASVEAWLEPAKSPPDIVNEIKALSYQSGPFWIFADLPLIWAKLPDIDARGRLLKALMSEETWMVKLYVDATSDITALSEYWGRGGRVNQVRPYLEALSQARNGQGGWTSIRSILPPFVQTRLFTFPLPTQNAIEQQRDCHWTAMNFFATTPNDAFAANVGAVDNELRAHYTEVYANQMLGDVIVFVTRDGNNVKAFHSAVYIAENLIFTKNGRRAADPFMFMKLEEMKSYYPQSAKVELLYYRRKATME